MKTISLCMICGNEEAIILRCLDSAKDAFDELCLVRAIGDKHGDNTLHLASQWCLDNRKGFQTREYVNTIRGLQHVDHFAEARNLSFDLATSDWQLWLDCDDVLTPEACQGIRDCANEASAEAYAFMYAKPGGSSCPRERLVRRGKGRWKNRIHETCQIPSGDLCLDKDVTVLHAPIGEKRPSHERNMRLLAIALDDAPRHYFYQHEEFYNAKDIPNAIKTGKAAIHLLENAPEEVYEICLNLAEMESAHAHDWLFKAIELQPWRREAFAYLTQEAIAKSDRNRAISYFRLMDSLPLPDPLPWTHRAIWHGWARNYLRVQILRLSGDSERATSEHTEHMKNVAYAQGVAQHEAKS